MKKAIYFIATRWDKLGKKLYNWCKSGTWIVRLPKALVTVVALVLFIELMASFSGLLMLSMPRFTGYLIAFCLIVPLLAIVLTPLLWKARVVWPSFKGLSENIWIIGISLSVVLMVFSAFLGFFDPYSGLGIQRSILSKYLSDKTRFPIADPSGFAVDNEGRIYLAIPTYSRIQVYNDKGDFQRGWFVVTGGGLFDIWIEDNLLHAVTARPDNHDVFDLSGKLLKSSQIQSTEEDRRLWERAGGLKEQEVLGSTYSIQSPGWRPKVIKNYRNIEPIVIVRDPFYFWITRQVQPLWLLTLGGIIMTFILWVIIKLNIYFCHTDFDANQYVHPQSPV